MASKTSAAAQDATVETDMSPERLATKRAAAVEYHRRELAAAEESVKRLEGKGDKLRAQAADADAALDEARAWATTVSEQLAMAESVAGGDR